MVIGTPTVLNLIPGGVMKVIHVNQVNENIEIQFRIMNGAQQFNVPEGVSCTIRGTKGDNFGYAADVAVTAGSNIVTVTLTEQLTAVAGAGNIFELVFVGASDDMKVSTENFLLDVERAALGEDTVISDSDLAYADQVLDQLQSVGAVNAQVQQNKANIAAEITRATAAEQTLQQNINAEAAARQAADNTLQSNINAEASSRATTDTSLQSQINQLVAPSGEAPSAAEVENARIGSDGTVYPTLGDAIRTQNSLLKSHLDYLADGGIISFTKGGYIVTSGDTADVNSVVSNAGWLYAVVDCVPGDYFYIHATGGSSPRAYAFINASGTVLSRELPSTETNGVVVAPENSAKLIINKQLNAEAYPSYKGRNLPDWIEAVEEKTESVDSDVNLKLDHGFGGANTHIAYNNTTKITGTEGYNISKQYDVASYIGKTINIKTISQIYYNIYTFLNASGTVLTYQRENNETNKAYDLDIVVPANASTMVVTCGNENLGNVVVSYTETVNKTELINGLGLPKELRSTFFGYFYTNTTKAAESPNYIQSARYDVTGVREVNIKMHSDLYYNIYTFVDDNDNVIAYSREETSGGRDYDFDIVVPAYAKYLFLSSYERYYTYVVIAKYKYCGAVNQWTDKQVVWLGTSIPATARLGLGRQNSYPMKVARLLGADVYNEAVGSSALHCKSPTRISEDNPYGFLANFEAVSRCLTNTVEEMQWIIDHYNSPIFTEQTVSSMTSDLSSYILSCSYQNKIDKYYANGNKPSLWVIDHGHNDWPTAQTEQYYNDDHFSLYSFKGALNFIIRYILEKDPFARIVIIGEYSDKYQPFLVECQEYIANLWNIPIYKQWDVTGFSNMEITTTGYYDKGIWQESGGASQDIDMKDVWIPDGIHPNFDRTGRTIMMMATGIAGWMRTIGNF